MDENEIQQLQDELASAYERGDKEKEREISQKIDSLFGMKPQEEPKAEEEAVTTETTEEVAPEAVVADGEQAKTAEAEGSTEAPPPAEKPEGEVRENTASEQNWIDSLAPEIRKHAEQLLEERKRLEHRIKADDGRVAAYQRRYHELQKKSVQLEEENRALKSSPKPQPKPVAASTNPEIDDDLKAILEVDEQLGRALIRQRELQEQKIAALEKKLEEFDSKATTFSRHLEDQESRTELDRLQEEWPNALDVFRSREWSEWVEMQPRGVQELAKSGYAEEVSQAFQLYSMYLYRTNPEIFQQAAPSEPAAPATNPKAEAVQRERERKLSAQPVGSTAIKPPTTHKPTMAEIMSNPELLDKERERVYQEEIKKLQEQGRLV